MAGRAKLTRRDYEPAARGALDGLRVVDLSRLVAGNVLTKVLADAGAEVVKVEPPAGDSLRAWKVKGLETSWKTYCRNKRSVCLDLRAPEGVEVVRRLARDAAILVESFRPGVLEAMGLAPEAAAEAARYGRGSFTVDGRMVDEPMLIRARRIIAQAGEASP